MTSAGTVGGYPDDESRKSDYVEVIQVWSWRRRTATHDLITASADTYESREQAVEAARNLNAGIQVKDEEAQGGPDGAGTEQSGEVEG
jgi:hypothetical protein